MRTRLCVHRIHLTVSAVLAALTFMVGSAPLMAQTLPDGESLANPPAQVDLSWTALPADDGRSVSGPGTLTLKVANLTSAAFAAEVQATADAGTPAAVTLPLGTYTLPAAGSVSLTVNLASFGLDLAGMHYSGQVMASAQAAAPGGDETAISPAVYFHPVAGSSPPRYVYYRDAALAASFRAGDYGGRALNLTEAGAVTTRVVGGGAGEVTTGPGGTASTHSYTTCIRWQIETVDSSHGISNGPNAGGTEDQYLGCDAGCAVKARGVRVKMSRGAWDQTYDSDSNGCFSWTSPATDDFSMRVYGYATDVAGNFVRIHTDPNDFAAYPAQTYSILVDDVTPTNGGTNTYDVGSNSSRWTAMAALGFGLYRYHTGLTNKAFHVGMDGTQCGGSSAHYGSSNSAITSGRHYLRIGNCAVGNPQSRRKFIVTHELGHAIAALYYGAAPGAAIGGEPGVSSANNVNPNACGISGTSYSIQSKEWNSVGFREGFAHFIAARIWNDKDPEGAFRWFEGSTHDLERWGYGAGAGSGGRLENVCCVGGGCGASWANAGTIEDWMRFFWDFYNNVDAACPQQPDALDLMNLYKQTRLNGGLSGSNYFSKMRTAAGQIGLPACLSGARFDAYAAYNGIDNN